MTKTSTLVQQIEPSDEEYLRLREQLDESYLPIAFKIFDSLGEIDINDPKYQEKPGFIGKLTEKEKECKQYLTLTSV